MIFINTSTKNKKYNVNVQMNKLSKIRYEY